MLCLHSLLEYPMHDPHSTAYAAPPNHNFAVVAILQNHAVKRQVSSMRLCKACLDPNTTVTLHKVPTYLVVPWENGVPLPHI
jgi:hypothetical protein